MLKIRPLHSDDKTDLSVLLISTFDQPNELNLVRALREQDKCALELVAVDDTGLVGYICLSKLDAPQGWLALAPMCVRNENQGTGVGREMVLYALDQARQMHFDAVVVVGHPDYYKRHGFVFGGPVHLSSPYPEDYTGLYLIHPGITETEHRLVYPEPFDNV
ncbi:N-acetyltransferase [Rhodobacteraceae bacterium SC52]|nr:N-acetyltransferase [Rhodobacteraceae bacterium SC52]